MVTVMALLTPLLLSLWLCVTVSKVVDLQKRIIGGQKCGPQERLYHVQLLVNTGTEEFFCGGSLISNQWILTATHCWQPGWTINAVLGVHHSKVQVEIKAPPEIFTNYGKNNNMRSHDIMLLKLPTSTRIRPVPLPNCRKGLKIGNKVQIAGHAATTGGPNNERIPAESSTLQCADIKVVSCEPLRNTLKKENHNFYIKMSYLRFFCGQSPGVDGCSGDSGGGVVYEGKIFGVMSFAGNITHVCAAPVVFMDICNQNYMKWIKETIDWQKRACGLFCG